MRRLSLLVSSLLIAGCTLPPGPVSPSRGSSAPAALPGSQPAAPSPSPVESPFEVQKLTPEQVKARMDAGERILLADVRPRRSFERMRITGAESYPLSEIGVWGPTLSPAMTLVFY